jgi:hypothetical protein
MIGSEPKTFQNYQNVLKSYVETKPYRELKTRAGDLFKNSSL